MTMTSLPLPTLAPPSKLTGLPVAIIGAGPVGLAAAAQLLERGIEPIVYEAGPQAGSAISLWGHTRLFSPWEYLIDGAAARLLGDTAWERPSAQGLPLGSELVDDYLVPLAATPALSRRIQYNSSVTAVSRLGMDRTRSNGRSETPFALRIQTDDGPVDRQARAVIDTSGTYSTPNSIVASGLPLLHRGSVQDDIVHALPDVAGADRSRFAGKHTLVVGAGHSAANTLIALARLATEVPGTSVTWAIRNTNPVRVYGSADDELAARASLGSRVYTLVDEGAIALIDGFEIDDVVAASDGWVSVIGRRAGETLTIETDVVVGATGFRPDLEMLREIRLSLDEIVEAPRALAPLIDPNLHSCGTVPAHGVDVLAHPEPNFYIAGMKSYGRAPTFLLATGYEQVRSIADEIAGNREAARTVQLVLPETGVCSTGDTSGSCC
ncbi:FAD-dependent oxidoreductase [Glaciibacter superstes]|uniref:FAD-dependent oxidoreductase n=1 Tax=Glaciibacter superstes TaxID=501023 RepID=UPI0003B30D1C|nr:FAD-dependent oxidoreductase [Glaciibacter superstes]